MHVEVHYTSLGLLQLIIIFMCNTTHKTILVF